MMLRALYDLAADEELMGDPDYEPRPVAWLVRVDSAGKLGGVEGTHSMPETTAGRKPKPVAKSFAVPRQPVRTSGDRAFFLVDKAEYVFGIDPAGKREPAKLQLRARLFRDEVEACASTTGDEGVAACLCLLSELADGKQRVDLPEEVAGNDLFAFVFAPDVDRLVSSRSKVRAYWKEQRVEKSLPDGAPKCLITGEPCVPGVLHVPLKRLPRMPRPAVCPWSRSTRAPSNRTAGAATRTLRWRGLRLRLWHRPKPPSTPGLARLFGYRLAPTEPASQRGHGRLLLGSPWRARLRQCVRLPSGRQCRGSRRRLPLPLAWQASRSR